MTMFLMNTLQAQVEPVPGNIGWFQLTGQKILRHSMDTAEILEQRSEDQVLVENPKLLGLHDADDDIEDQDPRFSLDEPGFGVALEDDGTYTMYLACNRAEYTLFRFLVPHESGNEFDEEDDPISNYRK